MLRGPHSRRDERTKGNNVVAGFRMEPALAAALTQYAREHVVGVDGRADLATAARMLLRHQLRQHPLEDSRPLTEATRGMKVDAPLFDALERYQQSTELSFIGAVRHLIRLGLGFTDEDSVERERHFAALADARRGLGLSGAAQFGGAKGK